MEAAAEETQKDGTEIVQPDNNTTDKPTPSLAEPLKKSKKDDRMKKDDKNVEQFMKSLNSVPTLEEKLSLVCKKYVQTADDNKKLQFYIKQSDKRYALLSKEKEQLQLEFNKTVLVKSKLENLCRELQKQNKAIKEESLLKIREEEERRKETQAKFQNTLTEITSLLQQNNEKNAKLRDDNISMSEKFKSVVQQYQLREQQVDKMAKQMALESQLSDAKLQKASLEHQADRERLLAEMEQIKVNVAQYRAKIVELQGTETSLRSQLAVYTDKYDEFQKALVKSNQVFGGFKEQMEMMTKKIKKLEKESLSWKKRWETSQSALIEMCTERQAGEERAAAGARHLHHMQGLCRTLQAERGVLLATLKEHNIERPPLPTPPPAPAPPPPAPAPAPASNAKVDAMAANCAQLRQSLAHLQSQLNVLTNKQQDNIQEEPPKPEKPKKSKSKKKSQKVQEKPEVEDAPKEPEESQPSVSDEKVENSLENSDDKVDDQTLESLIDAINNANINLCDLEVGNGDSEDVLEEILKDVESTSLENVEINDCANVEIPSVANNGDLSNEEISTIESIVTELKEAEIDKSSEIIEIANENTKDVIAEVSEAENSSSKVDISKVENKKIEERLVEVKLTNDS